MSDSKDTTGFAEERREWDEQEARDRIIDSFEQSQKELPSLDSIEFESDGPYAGVGLEADMPVDPTDYEPFNISDQGEALNDWLSSTAANDTNEALTDHELLSDFFDVAKVEAATEVLADKSFEQLIDRLKNCDASVVSVISGGQDNSDKITMFQMPPVDSEHYEAIAEIANLNGIGADGRMQQTKLDGESMLLIDNAGRAGVMPKDARFHFSNPFGSDREEPENLDSREADEPLEEHDSLLGYLQSHLAEMMELRKEQIKNPDKGGPGGGGGLPSLFGGKKNSLDKQIEDLNTQIAQRIENPSLQESVKKAASGKSLKSHLQGLGAGSGRDNYNANPSSKDYATVAKIAKSPAKQVALMTQVSEKADQIKGLMDTMNSEKSRDPAVLKEMSNNIRNKFFETGGLAHLSTTLNLVNERNGFTNFGKNENAPELVKKMKESLDSVRLHPLADRLSIDGLKLMKMPGLESLNKAIQDISNQVSRVFEGLSATLTSIGRNR